MSYHASFINAANRNSKYLNKPVRVINTNGGQLLTIEEATKLRDGLTRAIDKADKLEVKL